MKLLVSLALLFGLAAIAASLECKNDLLGNDYQGSKTRTKSGKKCLRWDQMAWLAFGHRDFPDGHLKLAGNKCRNPGKVHGPWCYTGAKTWEFCDVKECSKKFKPGENIATRTG